MQSHCATLSFCYRVNVAERNETKKKPLYANEFSTGQSNSYLIQLNGCQLSEFFLGQLNISGDSKKAFCLERTGQTTSGRKASLFGRYYISDCIVQSDHMEMIDAMKNLITKMAGR